MAKPHRRFELENKVKQLTRKLARKNEVIAEVVEHNIFATFYYLCSILDGFSRYIAHWRRMSSAWPDQPCHPIFPTTILSPFIP
jgi:hypothetical protein